MHGCLFIICSRMFHKMVFLHIFINLIFNRKLVYTVCSSEQYVQFCFRFLSEKMLYIVIIILLLILAFFYWLLIEILLESISKVGLTSQFFYRYHVVYVSKWTSLQTLHSDVLEDWLLIIHEVPSSYEFIDVKLAPWC